MKILEQTPTRLTIQHKPIEAWIVGTLIGGIGASLGINGLVGQPVITHLHCDRHATNVVVCQQQRSTLLGIKSQQVLSGVRSAQSVEHRAKGSPSYYVAIANDVEQVEVTNSRHQTETISQIEAFLNNDKTPFFRIRYSRFEDTYGFLLGGTLFFLAGLWFLTMSITQCIFYKTLQKIVIQQTGLLGKREVEYSLFSFHHAAIEEERTKNGKVYYLVLWLKDGKKVKLTRDTIKKRQSLEIILAEIQSFLS